MIAIANSETQETNKCYMLSSSSWMNIYMYVYCTAWLGLGLSVERRKVSTYLFQKYVYLPNLIVHKPLNGEGALFLGW